MIKDEISSKCNTQRFNNSPNVVNYSGEIKKGQERNLFFVICMDLSG
jgi:hypothetical protein